MLNVTVVSNLYDSSGNRIDCWYSVTYKTADITTPEVFSTLRQINFNVGDPNHLGKEGTLVTDDILYLHLRYEDSYGVTHKVSKRITYTGGSTIVLTSRFPSDTCNLDLDYTVDIDTYTVKASADNAETYYFTVYGNSTDVYKEATPRTIIIDTVDTGTDSIRLTFNNNGTYTVECDAVDTEGNVITSSILLTDVKTINSNTDTCLVEWE